MTDQANPEKPDIEEAVVVAESAPPEKTPAPVVPRRGGFVPAFLGGVMAAGAGFGLAWYGVQAGWPLLQPAPLVQPAELQALATRVQALESQLAAVAPTDPAYLKALEDRLAALETRPAGPGGDPAALAELRDQIGTLATRLAEQQTLTTQISAEIERQVAGRLAAAETESARLKAEAEAQAQATERRAALLTLETALSAGLPAAEPAARAEAAGAVLPDPVKALIAAPVTLPELQAQFSEVALTALNLSLQATMGDGWQDRLTTFLRTQTGARSLTPKEGDDPDAVLSRIDAALRMGDVAAALTLMDALPEAGRVPLAGWAGAAGRYAAGHAALSQLLAK